MSTPVNPLAQRAIQIHERLLEFYGEPIWRNPLPAIDELVSTILSQNTNDNNRDRAFNSLRAKFPTWEEVRDADTADVVNAIRPAGLAASTRPPGPIADAGPGFRRHRRMRTDQTCPAG